MDTYRIVRFFFKDGPEVLETGVSLEDAQEHCNDPETSSRTCTKPENVCLTAERGPWFDGYTQE